MALFAKKKEGMPAAMPPPGPISPPEGVPTSLVIQMRKQGLTNNQIALSLQREGYTSSQIFDAMSQADIKGLVESPGEDVSFEAGPTPSMPPPISEGYGQQPQNMPQMQAPPPMSSAPPEMSSHITKEEIEEIAESIIDEKWEELMKALEKVVTWKDSAESRLIKMEQKVEDLTSQFDALHKGVLGKIEEYDRGVKDVGTDIKAMEEVFKKTLPTFTENIHELSRLTRHIKSKKKKQI